MPKGHYVRTKFRPISERLFAKVNKTRTCWEWTGSVGQMGHGQIMADRNTSPTRHLLSTHRVSWEIHIGPIPDGLCVLHKCDNPRCVRPSHLFLGTKADNTADMLRKQREARGVDLPQAKLTEKQVLAIRSAEGPQSAIAKRYGISQSLVSNIRRRVYWKHL
jgi:DNA-binding CsgD family transcriptional regulator